MEQIQQVSAHIASDKLGEARALFDDLEAHSRSLRGRRGFSNMRINRSVESDGSTLVSVETRWTDGGALNEYANSVDNAESIIRRHESMLTGDGPQVRLMESAETLPAESTAIYERLGLALAIPVAIIGIGLAIIYALSRVYLEISGGGATAISIVVAVGILLVGAYFAGNPAPRWQYAGLGTAVAALLIGGTVYAQVHDGPHYEAHVEEEPTEEPVDGTPVAPGAVVIVMLDNEFEQSDIRVASGQEVTIDNAGRAIHNVHVAEDGEYDVAVCNANTEEPCSDPASIRGGQDGTIVFDLAPGDYDYRCDFHPTEMSGTVSVGPPAGPGGPGGPGGEPGAPGGEAPAATPVP